MTRCGTGSLLLSSLICASLVGCAAANGASPRETGIDSSDRSTAGASPTRDGSFDSIQLRFDDADRTYTLYRPASFKAGNPAVLLLHGGNQSVRSALAPRNPTRRWLDLSDEEGFVLIVPNGYNNGTQSGTGMRQSWNDLRADTTGRTSNADDAAFLLAVLEDVHDATKYDRDSVFVTGASNGGMMAMRMLIEHGERFAGAAAFIASLPAEEIALPTEPTPIMIVNGTEDALLRWEGGVVSNGGAPVRSVAETVSYFREVNSATDSEGTTSTLPDRVDDGCTVELTDYLSSDTKKLAVAFVKIEGGGHSLPDPNAVPFRNQRVNEMIGRRCKDVHGVDLAWEFFENVR